ncbi:hypothetical protein BKA70DRAFT_1239703 [Coprinopsis sp. MPI-PUGE-AT-0042]|nr:hypothetical protein BKA70DRAFT_1239703 [Coprinopsis sp. MPI-PUGE-AT-0042]
MYPSFIGSASQAYTAEDLKRLKDQDEEFRVRINLRSRHLHSNGCRRCRQHSLLCVPEGQSCEHCLRDQEQIAVSALTEIPSHTSKEYSDTEGASPPRKQPTSQAREVKYGAPRPLDLTAYGHYTHEIIAAAQAVASVQSGSPEKVMDVMALANFMVAGQGSTAPETIGFPSSLPVGNTYGDATNNHSFSPSTFTYGNEGCNMLPAFNAWPDSNNLVASSGAIIQPAHPFPAYLQNQ